MYIKSLIIYIQWVWCLIIIIQSCSVWGCFTFFFWHEQEPIWTKFITLLKNIWIASKICSHAIPHNILVCFSLKGLAKPSKASEILVIIHEYFYRIYILGLKQKKLIKMHEYYLWLVTRRSIDLKIALSVII